MYKDTLMLRFQLILYGLLSISIFLNFDRHVIMLTGVNIIYSILYYTRRNITMKRRKTVSKYNIDDMGRIKKKEITLSPRTEAMLGLSMLAEAFTGGGYMESLEGDILNEGNEEAYDLNENDNNEIKVVDVDGE